MWLCYSFPAEIQLSFRVINSNNLRIELILFSVFSVVKDFCSSGIESIGKVIIVDRWRRVLYRRLHSAEISSV